jgi:hypothetical protein
VPEKERERKETGREGEEEARKEEGAWPEPVVRRS